MTGSADTRFRIPRSLSSVHHSPDIVEFRRGVWNATSHVVRDQGGADQLSRVIRLLDGTRTTAEVALQCGVPREAVEGVVDHLLAQGLVETSAGSYLDHLVDLLGTRRAGTPTQRRIHVVGDSLAVRIAALLEETEPELTTSTNPHPTQELDRLATDDTWLGNGLEQTRALEPFASWAGSLVILADDVVDPHRSRALNRAALAHEFPTLHVALDGPFVLVGPLVVPDASACWECFETRLVMNLRDAAVYFGYKEALARGNVEGGADPVPVVASLAASLAVTDALSFVTTDEAVTINHAWSIFLPTMEIASHELLRVPGCAGCGAVPERDDADLYFDLRALTGGGTR